MEIILEARGVRSPGTGMRYTYEPFDMRAGLLGTQKMFLSAEPSLQAPKLENHSNRAEVLYQIKEI